MNVLDAYKSSALIQAVQLSSPDVVRLLIEHGANLNHMDTDSNFPLIAAVYRSKKYRNINITFG